MLKCIVKHFNSVILHGKVPHAWKQGVIIPLYKGGDKPKTSTNSYRPVPLKLGCLTASFNLQETINYYLEQGSNVYVSFLDSTRPLILCGNTDLFSKCTI